ncbi:hypothetical protein DFH06DRAFT_1129722 [Mycena polygramma]|nr:hypothetical protein DFH06DRAFT_1129722 [Mycena polygramma]
MHLSVTVTEKHPRAKSGGDGRTAKKIPNAGVNPPLDDQMRQPEMRKNSEIVLAGAGPDVQKEETETSPDGSGGNRTLAWHVHGVHADQDCEIQNPGKCACSKKRRRLDPKFMLPAWHMGPKKGVEPRPSKCVKEESNLSAKDSKRTDCKSGGSHSRESNPLEHGVGYFLARLNTGSLDAPGSKNRGSGTGIIARRAKKKEKLLTSQMMCCNLNIG